MPRLRTTAKTTIKIASCQIIDRRMASHSALAGCRKPARALAPGRAGGGLGLTTLPVAPGSSPEPF